VLTVAGYSGDAGDAMTAADYPQWRSNGKMFSTRDRDNDAATASCATDHTGGWWFDWCSRSSLNKQNQLSSWSTDGSADSVQTSRMLVKIN